MRNLLNRTNFASLGIPIRNDASSSRAAYEEKMRQAREKRKFAGRFQNKLRSRVQIVGLGGNKQIFGEIVRGTTFKSAHIKVHFSFFKTIKFHFFQTNFRRAAFLL